MARFLARSPLVAGILLMSMMVVACVPFRLEASWPALSIIPQTGHVLVTYNDRIVMIDPVTGELVRQRNLDGEVRLDESGNPRVWEFTGSEGQSQQFYSSPLQIDDETLLIPTFNSNIIYQVDLPTARIINAIQVDLPGQVISDLVPNGNMLYLGIGERNLVALDNSRLTPLWEFTTGQGVWSEPVIADGVLYFTSLDHNMYALNPETGEQIWRRDLQGAVASSPLLHDDRLYVGSFARKIYEITLDGVIAAQFDTEDWVWGAPVIVDDVLYAADVSGVVYAVSIRDGGFSELWRSRPGGPIRASPVVTDDYVIVGSRDHRLYWLDRARGTIVEDEPTVANVQNQRIRELAGEILSDILLIEPSDVLDIPEPYVLVSSVANQELLVGFKVSNGERLPLTYGR